jgi:hypothetical protein
VKTPDTKDEITKFRWYDIKVWSINKIAAFTWTDEGMTGEPCLCPNPVELLWKCQPFLVVDWRIKPISCRDRWRLQTGTEESNQSIAAIADQELGSAGIGWVAVCRLESWERGEENERCKPWRCFIDRSFGSRSRGIRRIHIESVQAGGGLVARNQRPKVSVGFSFFSQFLFLYKTFLGLFENYGPPKI